MEGKLYLSMDDGIAEISLDRMTLRHAPLEGAGTLCAGENSLFCAEKSGAIWRLDRKTLMMHAMGCGGPGICDMCLSACGSKLYVLLGEADSILMADAKTCRPLVLNRCGCCPQMLSCSGGILAAAGGMSGCVHLYDRHTLACIAQITMPGPVYSVVLQGDAMYALCLTPDLNTLLIEKKGDEQREFRLMGMPGSMRMHGSKLLVSTAGYVHRFTLHDAIAHEMRHAPGRASRIAVFHEQVALLDPLSASAFISQEAGTWRRLAGGVNDMRLL